MIVGLVIGFVFLSLPDSISHMLSLFASSTAPGRVLMQYMVLIILPGNLSGIVLIALFILSATRSTVSLLALVFTSPIIVYCPFVPYMSNSYSPMWVGLVSIVMPLWLSRYWITSFASSSSVMEILSMVLPIEAISCQIL